jgi:8-oxo-dGTP diphosphatase
VYEQLPSFYAATAALITETGTDRVLLVKPTYRGHWAFPGGYLEADEYPMTAAPGRSRKNWDSS